MPAATLEKTQVELPAELAKRYSEAKTPEERNTIMRDYAVTLGAENKTTEQAQFMTDEQFRSLLTKVGEISADQAKAAIASVAGEMTRKYNLNGDDARNMAERSFVSEEAKLRNKRADDEMIAKCFRGMLLAKQGKVSEYQRSLEEENDYMKRTYGRETRAMSNTTDSTGGYLSPQLFSDRLYEAIARTSLVRKYATIIPMNGYEVINFPTMTTGISAAVVSEATGVTGVQPVFSQKQLTTKKIMTRSTPISLELVEKSNPLITTLLLQQATVEILKAEDSAVFSGSGNGIRNTSTNLVDIGSVATSATDYSSVNFNDMISMETALAAQYLVGADIQGSGIINGGPQYWIPHQMKQALKKITDGIQNYTPEARELRSESKIFGWDTQRVLSLPDGTALSAADKVAIFGNLGHVFCGLVPGFRIDLLTEGTVDSVSLADTGSVAIRVIEYFDSVVIDPSAFSIGRMAA